MSDEFIDDPEGGAPAELTRLLSDPAVWSEPSPEVEDRLVAAITALRSEAGGAGPVGGDDPVIDLEQRRSRRAGGRRFWPLAAAAALLITAISAAAGFAIGRSDGGDLTTVALAPVDGSTSADVVVAIDDRPNGARLLVDIAGLAPAPPGAYYEVWLVRPDPRTAISAGTFHMRGSDTGEIEFWAGVSPEIYTTITVTLEAEAEPSADGELILAGDIASS